MAYSKCLELPVSYNSFFTHLISTRGQEPCRVRVLRAPAFPAPSPGSSLDGAPWKGLLSAEVEERRGVR